MAKLEEKRIKWLYDNAEFTVSNGITDYDVSTNQPSAFNNVSIATDISIRTSQDISIAFNSASNDSISIASTESPFGFDSLMVTNIYITNSSGNDSAIKIFMIGR